MLFWRTSGWKRLAAPYPWQQHVDRVMRRLQAGREFRANPKLSACKNPDYAGFPPGAQETLRANADMICDEQGALSRQALWFASHADREQRKHDPGQHGWRPAAPALGPGLPENACGWPCTPVVHPTTGFQVQTLMAPFSDPFLPRVCPGARVILQHLPPPSLLGVVSEAASGLAALLGWRRNGRRPPKVVARLSRSLWIAGNLLHGFGRLAGAMSLLRSNLDSSGGRQVTRPLPWRGFWSAF